MTSAGDGGGRWPPTCDPGPLDALLSALAAQLEERTARRVEAAIPRLVAAELARQRSGLDDGPATLSQVAAARLAGVSTATVRRWCSSGKLHRGHNGRIQREELRALLAGEQRPEPTAVDLTQERARRVAAALKGAR